MQRWSLDFMSDQLADHRIAPSMRLGTAQDLLLVFQ